MTPPPSLFALSALMIEKSLIYTSESNTPSPNHDSVSVMRKAFFVVANISIYSNLLSLIPGFRLLTFPVRIVEGSTGLCLTTPNFSSELCPALEWKHFFLTLPTFSSNPDLSPVKVEPPKNPCFLEEGPFYS